MSDLDRAKETSIVVAAVERAIGDSRLLGVLRSRWAGTREAITSTARTIEARWRSSQVFRATDAIAAVLDRSAGTSRVGPFATTVERWVQRSVLFRWLTAEPEPDVIVVDLRETMTLGPAITVLDRAIDVLAAGRPASVTDRIVTGAAADVRAAPIRAAGVVLLAAVAVGLALQVALGLLGTSGLLVTTVVTGLAVLGIRNDTSWETLRDARAIRLLVAALVPPEPPASDGTGDRHATTEDEADAPSQE